LRHRFPGTINDAPQQNIFRRNPFSLALLELRFERPFQRIGFPEESRLESFRDDQNSEEQSGIEFFDLKLAISTRPGAFAAIRIARRSYITWAHPRPGRVNENRSTRHRRALFIHHLAGKVRLFLRGQRYPRDYPNKQNRDSANLHANLRL
jgi:hypothetical protein